MTTRIYRSDDSGAPVLTGQVGTLITVLTKCLVDGYGSKTAAGWSIALSGTNKVIFQNTTGKYYRIQDNGLTDANYATVQGNIASICGVTTFTGIDNFLQPYPRVISGGDIYSARSYGVTIQKRKMHDVNPSHTSPWIVIADERTCYLITGWTTNNTNATSDLWTTSRGVYGFGDIELFNSGDTNSADAFVMGGSLVSVGWFSGPITTDYREYSIGYLYNANHMGDRIFLNKSQENGAHSVAGRLYGQMYNRYGGDCRTAVGDGQYIRYTINGSVITGGVVLNPLMVCEDTADTIRTVEYAAYGLLSHGKLRGIQGCMHTTDTANMYKLTTEGSTITIDGTDYFIFSTLVTGDTIASNCLAISLGAWT
jgi:hypothetical protein